ncbi:MAG TPA: oxygenase MpaB family protein [Pseudomonadales bacterium]|nr:oxygenase MpaB family protein [Pseudomonadales bacterium]
MVNAAWQRKYSNEFLDSMRHLCDPLADAVTAQMNRQRPSAMLDEVERRAKTEGGAFQAFLDQVNTVPAWVDWRLIEQARKVSLAFANVRGMALLVSSLVEGYALSKATHVLIATGRLHQDVTRRIFETAQMSHNMHVKDGLRPGGMGHRIILEVRLLHSMVRKYLKQRDWDVAKYDEPVNQEDMAFTIIEFDYLAVRGMERMGASLSKSDRRALHHFWRYAAYLHGVDERLLTDSPEEEIYQYQRIRERQYNPNEESRLLAQTVLESLAGKPPFNLKVELLNELSRLCLGDALADAYQLPKHLAWRQAVKAYIGLNKALTFAHYKIPGMGLLSERLNFQAMQKALHENLEPEENKRAFRHIA